MKGGRTMQRSVWLTVGILLSFVVQAESAAMGIPLDAFLNTYTTFIVGTGLVVGLAGLTGWILAQMENEYGNMFAGGIRFFGKAGLLGGGTVMLTALGLVGGATL
jgi:hypothetical protein